MQIARLVWASLRTQNRWEHKKDLQQLAFSSTDMFNTNQKGLSGAEWGFHIAILLMQAWKRIVVEGGKAQSSPNPFPLSFLRNISPKLLWEKGFITFWVLMKIHCSWKKEIEINLIILRERQEILWMQTLRDALSLRGGKDHWEGPMLTQSLPVRPN